ncbi:MAG: hypothetical protein DRI57_23405, partial [Deltaproteobacteria bacterium]
MCNFFSFISDGKGNVKYFNLEQRKQISIENPDDYNVNSHSSIAEFYFKNNTADDNCNKFEFSSGNFIVDQINTNDDSKKCKKWINQFSNSNEFIEICKLAVTQNGNSIEYVPDSLKTEEICKLAVTQNGYSIKYVPDSLKTEEICKLAVT